MFRNLKSQLADIWYHDRLMLGVVLVGLALMYGSALAAVFLTQDRIAQLIHDYMN